MFVLILIVHLLVCFSLILVVLLQSGKGGGLAGAFGGGGGSQALFGGRGAATFLSKATTFLGAGFMLTSLGLALLSGAHRGNISKQPESLMKKSQQEAPLQPGPGTAPAPSGQQEGAPLAPPAGPSSQPAPGQTNPAPSPNTGTSTAPGQSAPSGTPSGGPAPQGGR